MTHPGTLIEQGVKEYGYELMIQATLELLCGEVPAIPLQAFGGTSGWQPYWLPTWGARACLYLWHEDCTEPILAGLGSEFWRAREMCAKVCRYREVGLSELSPLLNDPIPRVRAAAARAIGSLGEVEHAQGLKKLRTDPEASVRTAANSALKQLAERLDRPMD
ncbi:hypothetical protein FHU41_002749 [Psychromicrobium silvestre]|uniref:HEAT repeat domain-containing protein n=1 Tax=Psychromicrobium silvestre TaxID=1645614 RepID=A0A7Y9S837_9MICC|nr:HEAT repeat domain-containing protein [Psychromicrobium silvestre]NYE96499.1 hypothetical protein [Psychromicrobium silvestre]